MSIFIPLLQWNPYRMAKQININSLSYREKNTLLELQVCRMVQRRKHR